MRGWECGKGFLRTREGAWGVGKGFLVVRKRVFEGMGWALWGYERGSLRVRERLFGEAEWAIRIVGMVQMADCQ